MGQQKTIEISFSGGIQSPPNLTTIVLKPTGEGKLSYAQNVTNSNDKYGDNVVTPGPYLSPLATGLSNPIYWKATVPTVEGGSQGSIWLGSNNSGVLTYISGIGAGNNISYGGADTVSIKSGTVVSGHGFRYPSWSRCASYGSLYCFY